MKSRFVNLLLLMLILQTTLSAQKKFNGEWVLGLQTSNIVSYQNNLFTVDRKYDSSSNAKHWFLQGSNICDSLGRLYLASNGYNVLDSNGNYVDGLDSIGGREFMKISNGFAKYNQYSIFLPIGKGIYYFVNNSVSDFFWNYYQNTPNIDFHFDELMYTKFDMKGNWGSGITLEREIKIIEQDSLSNTQMMACRHANGIDWWLLKQGVNNNWIYKFLFTNDSVINKGVQIFSQPTMSRWCNGGQSMFSQDGTKYATTNRGTEKIFVADFDRCTGILSNPLVYSLPPLNAHNPFDSTQTDTFSEGLAFSPNGRFIYVYMFFNIQQLDLWDNNPTTQWSVVAELDTTWDAFQSYSNMQLGPDNKLYVGNWANVLCKQMSYFNNPDAKGLASDFCPRCLRFPNYGVTRPPNMPNYDLGEDLSICWPVSSPQLEVGNEQLMVFPNPTYSKFQIKNSKCQSTKELYNSVGQMILSTKENEIEVSHLSKGIYYLRCENQSVKVVVE